MHGSSYTIQALTGFKLVLCWYQLSIKLAEVQTCEEGIWILSLAKFFLKFIFSNYLNCCQPAQIISLPDFHSQVKWNLFH